MLHSINNLTVDTQFCMYIFGPVSSQTKTSSVSVEPKLMAAILMRRCWSWLCHLLRSIHLWDYPRLDTRGIAKEGLPEDHVVEESGDGNEADTNISGAQKGKTQNVRSPTGNVL